MTKADLIAVVADKLKFPWARAELLVDQIFACMTNALQQGEGIEIRGFGTFKVREKKARRARNPRSGEEVMVPAKVVPVFKPSHDLKNLVLAGEGGTPPSA